MSVTLVTGGRDYNDRETVFARLDIRHNDYGIGLLVHGACRDRKTGELCGADGLAEKWAISREVPYLGVPAEWGRYGNSAGPRRNRQMPTMCRAFGVPVEHVIAFPGGSGTADMAGYAEGLGIPVEYVP